MHHRFFLGIILACGLGILSGCDSAEERAEKHYQVALEHIANGDVQRATVEFRNVFKLNGQHKEARLTYARMQREQGAHKEAYSQYLRLVEQHPDNLEGRTALAEMALSTRNWDEVERHGKVAFEQAPDDKLVQSINAALEYRAATLNKDIPARKLVLEQAVKLVSENPELIIAHGLIIDDLLIAQNWDAALEAIDVALDGAPDAKELYPLRLGVLSQLGDSDEIEAQLKKMIAESPDENEIQAMLVRWYIEQGNLDGAEAFLRNRIETTDDKSGASSDLIQFLVTNRSSDAARAELDSIITSNPPNVSLFRSLRATLNFDAGQHDSAIAEMEEILEDAEDSLETDNVKVMFARMLIGTGNNVGARAQVEAVLNRDKTHVDALKLKANWLIDDDETGDAMIALRTALGQSPRDPKIMTLMARAHERDGNKELIGEMLSLAVEASGAAPDESLRYARYLVGDDKLLPAEDVILEALRLQPKNTSLLSALGDLYLNSQDWSRADQVIRTLKKIDTPVARGMVTDLTTRKLNLQNRGEELSAFLEALSAEGGGGAGVDVAVIRAFLVRGDTEAALAHADSLLAQSPDDPSLRTLRALVLISDGQLDEAEKSFHTLLSENPQNEQVWMSLYRLHLSKDDVEAATSTLNDARDALPDSPNLKWVTAGNLEKSGDIDGAIVLYEELYALNSNSAIIANNLASLLSNHRDDAESLKRAQKIARRLRGTKLPPSQDTYGWISFRMGNFDEALSYLKPAAIGLPDDPSVQFHLAMTFAALKKDEEALALFEKTAAMISKSDPPAYLNQLMDEIQRLSGVQTQETENN